ncbi:single-stranded DNA-binding protein [Rummeliibacillus pycnus]|uniref:single-stranded DNA-binding protein n=1 Tax=Rummeliibacillus pycnus TaxID=101070 RepID=UPI003D2E6CC5
MNTISLIGRLTKDATLRNLQNGGKAVVNFTLAVNRDYKDGNGEVQADFILCQAWGKTAENIAKFTKKGSKIGVTGRLQTRTFDNDNGGKSFITEVVVEKPEFLDPKPASQQNSSSQQYQPQGQQSQYQQPNYQQNVNNRSYPNGFQQQQSSRNEEDPFARIDYKNPPPNEDDLPF